MITASHCVNISSTDKYQSGTFDTNSRTLVAGRAGSPATDGSIFGFDRSFTYPTLSADDPPTNMDLAVLGLSRFHYPTRAAKLEAQKLSYPQTSKKSLTSKTSAYVVGYGGDQGQTYSCGTWELESDCSSRVFAQEDVFPHGPGVLRGYPNWWRSGDSGGPLFLEDGNTIVGIVSRSDETSNEGFAVDVGDPNAQAWIKDSLDQLDFDHDGIPDACDLCPDNSGVWGAESPDSDGDGVPDACDECPCDPNETDPTKSGDGDGLCGHCDKNQKDKTGKAPTYCADRCGSGYFAVDNCPDVANPGQEGQKNSN